MRNQYVKQWGREASSWRIRSGPAHRQIEDERRATNGGRRGAGDMGRAT
jgi:hypothetical protein